MCETVDCYATFVVLHHSLFYLVKYCFIEHVYLPEGIRISS